MNALLKANTNKKQTFLGGAAVLALATAIVKVIGACYKIPLGNLLGDDGFGYFSTAYDIYSVLLMISTTGLPVAMSRMISEAKTLGQTRQIRQIFRTSFFVFLSLGVVGTAGMALLCRRLAVWMNHEQSWFAILCLSPAVLFVCLISAERGFFQGQANMVPTSISQVLEALCKLIVGLALAYLFTKTLGTTSYAAGGAILGVTLGTFISFLYLSLRRRRIGAEMLGECLDPTVYSTKSTAKRLLAIAIPITIGQAGLQIITTIDVAVYMGQLKGSVGMTEQVADELKGIYNFCQTVFNMPCAFIAPLTISVIPAVTEHLTLRRRRAANTVAESAVRVMSLIAMPCSIGLAVLSRPVMELLRDYKGQQLEIAATLMSILGFCVFFNSFAPLMNAIMQAHGHVYIPVINMAIGGISKIIIDKILVSNPEINIVGVPIATVICYMLISVLNLISMRCVLQDPPRLFSILLKPLIASAVMGGAAYGLSQLTLSMQLSPFFQTLISILGAGAVYIVMVLSMKIITKEDCNLLPKGDKIARLLRIS